MAKAHPSTRVLEELYFHVSNGGLNLRVLEKTDSHKPGKLWPNGYSAVSHRFEFSMGNHGEYATGSFPLSTVAQYDFLIQALTDAREALAKTPSDRYSPFKESGINPIRVTEGLTVEKVYDAERVTGLNSTTSRFLGYKYLNPDGSMNRFESAEDYVARVGPPSEDEGTSADTDTHAGTNASGSNRFLLEEIGMTIREVKARRPKDFKPPNLTLRAEEP